MSAEQEQNQEDIERVMAKMALGKLVAKVNGGRLPDNPMESELAFRWIYMADAYRHNDIGLKFNDKALKVIKDRQWDRFSSSASKAEGMLVLAIACMCGYLFTMDYGKYWSFLFFVAMLAFFMIYRHLLSKAPYEVVMTNYQVFGYLWIKGSLTLVPKTPEGQLMVDDLVQYRLDIHRRISEIRAKSQ